MHGPIERALPPVGSQRRDGKDLFIWHEPMNEGQAHRAIVGCRNHLSLILWQDPATRRIVTTIDHIEGVNRTGGHTVRYLLAEETGPFDDQRAFVERAITVWRASASAFMEIDLM